MITRVFAALCFAILGFGSSIPAAQAQPLRVVETMPANGTVYRGLSSEYYVRFDHPVDHIQSSFMIKRGDEVIEVLQPRFKTEPDVLFALAPTLPPGSYTFGWTVRRLDGTEEMQGEVAFSVATDGK